MNQYRRANQYYNEALNLLGQGDQQPYFYEVYKDISLVYTALDDYPKAHEYEQLYVRAKNARPEVQLLTEHHLELLQAYTSEKTTRRHARVTIAMTLVLALIAVALLYFRYAASRKAIRARLSEIIHLGSSAG